jgi:hypothetical protein
MDFEIEAKPAKRSRLTPHILSLAKGVAIERREVPLSGQLLRELRNKPKHGVNMFSFRRC